MYVRPIFLCLPYFVYHVSALAVPTLAPAPKPKPQDLPKSKPLLSAPIFKSSTASRSPLHKLADGLSANGELTAAVEEAAAKTENALPELFRSVRADAVLEKTGVKEALEGVKATVDEGKERAVAVVKSVPASTQEVRGLLARTVDHVGQVAGTYAPPAVRTTWAEVEKWWVDERVVKVAEACLPRREMDVLVIKSRLTLLHLLPSTASTN
jgi:nucleoporin NDC1